MAQKVILQSAGLATDPSPLLPADSGGLRVAEHVVIDQPGVIAPRPGFNTAAFVTSTDQRPRSMRGFDNGLVASSYYAVGDTYGMYSGIAGAMSSVSGGENEPLDSTRSWVQFAEARKNLYWSSKKGPYKLTDSADTVAARAGMHEAPSGGAALSASGSPVALATDSVAAWRWCFRKIDANDLETRSAPSPWATVSNSTGGTRDVIWTIPLPTYIAANDQIELYRTFNSTPASAVPPDMMYLVKRHTVSSAEVTAGFVAVTDDVSDNSLGAELYTNPTREGFLRGNFRPPASIALSTWQECTWYGYTVGPYTGAFDIKNVSGVVTADGSTGLQRLRISGTATNGSPTITGFVSTASVEVGMLCTDNGVPGTTGGTVPVGATVLSKTATTVTLTANATASVVGNVYFHDGITIDGLAYWASDTTSSLLPAYPTFAVTANDPETTAQALAYVLSVISATVFAYAIEDPYAVTYIPAGGGAPGSLLLRQTTTGTVVVRSVELDDSLWTITSTRTAALSYQANTSGGILVERDERPNGLAYSKPNEPEHVPEVNYLAIGSERGAIMALAPLRGALIVFKEDGIFRVTGSAPDNWAVDVIEPNIRVVRGDAVGVMGPAAYAWCESAVYEVTEGAARDISTGAISNQLAPYAQRAGYFDSRGAWLSCWYGRDLVLVGVPTASATTDTVYVYSTRASAWSEWPTAAWCATCDTGRLYLARGGPYFEVRADRLLYESFVGADAEFTISSWTYSAGTTTVIVANTDIETWSPAVGDWLKVEIGGTNYYRQITAGSFSSPNYTLTIDSAFPAGAQSNRRALEAIASTVVWQASVPGTPAATGLWRELHIMLDWSAYTGSIGASTGTVEVGAISSVSQTASSVDWSLTRAALPTVDARVMVPVAHARAAHIYPRASINDIGLEWRICGAALVFEPTSERTRR